MCYRLIPMFLTISAVFAAPQDFPGSTSVESVPPLPSDQAQYTDRTITEIESKKENTSLVDSITADVVQDPTERSDITENDQSVITTDYIDQQTTTVVPITTEKYIPRKPSFIKPKPKFVSKLSYFNKASVFDGIASTNLVERTGKRKFKSHCRCEKIWNCPKLQITVPRCPDEYFLCCF